MEEELKENIQRKIDIIHKELHPVNFTCLNHTETVCIIISDFWE
jgi:hypothetical protein